MESRMVWQVNSIRAQRVSELLSEGWEPFAVTTKQHPKEFAVIHHLRRQVAAV